MDNKQAKAILKSATETHGGCGEEAVFEAYMDEALRVSFEDKKNAFFAASRFFQAYNGERRAALNKKKISHKRISACEIPAVTQFFTPLHLSEYIVENSLGRLLYECGFDLGLKYLDGINNADFACRKTDIRKLRILDPAVGTGNLLYCAAKLMVKAYKASGYGDNEIKDALAANFIGLDIDDRACRLARRLLKQEFGADFDIVTLRSYSDEDIAKFAKWRGVAEGLANLGERGAISVFPTEEVSEICTSDKNTPETLKTFSIFDTEYDIILMNPPYLASSDCGTSLIEFIKLRFDRFKTDLFAVFVARCLQMLRQDGYMGVVCPFNWMFTKQYAGLRRLVLDGYDITNLAMLPADDYKDAVVYLSCFVLSGRLTGCEGCYIKPAKNEDTAEALRKGGKSFLVNQKRFLHTPYNSLIFWTSERFIQNFRKGALCDVLDIRQGLATGDNKRFLRKIGEVDVSDVAFDAVSIADFDSKGKLYAPYNKGGKYRKWYGNIDYVIRFDKEARAALAKSGNRMPSKDYYFRPCITWTLVSSKGHFGARLSANSVFDVGGSCGFPKKAEDIYVILGYLCSAVVTAYLNAQNPTINCQVGDIKNLPYIEPSPAQRARIEELVKQNAAIAKADWYCSEAPAAETVKSRIGILKRNEEELNSIFIDLYGLSGELNPEVPVRLITLRYK